LNKLSLRSEVKPISLIAWKKCHKRKNPARESYGLTTQTISLTSITMAKIGRFSLKQEFFLLFFVFVATNIVKFDI
jgi:hypothetical protein